MENKTTPSEPMNQDRMTAEEIYRKSAKGAEAIALRAHGVGGKLRMLLILVDGRKNVGELTRLAEGLGESFQLLTQLEAAGLIEPVSADVPPEGGMPAPGGIGEVDIEIEVDMDGAGVLRVDLDKARPLASRQLVELLGAKADGLIGKLDAARDAVQFIDAMKLAYAMVREVRGQSVADRFGDEVEASMWLA